MLGVTTVYVTFRTSLLSQKYTLPAVSTAIPRGKHNGTNVLLPSFLIEVQEDVTDPATAVIMPVLADTLRMSLFNLSEKKMFPSASRAI